jgi:hypothetical protein
MKHSTNEHIGEFQRSAPEALLRHNDNAIYYVFALLKNALTLCGKVIASYSYRSRPIENRYAFISISLRAQGTVIASFSYRLKPLTVLTVMF